MSAVLCVGNAVLDRIYRVPTIPTEPIKMAAEDMVEIGGGMAANAAVTVARLGAAAQLWARVGSDAAGAEILRGLASEGVDVTTVRRVANARSPTAAILVDRAGERLICAHQPAELDRDASWLPLRELTRFNAVLADVRWDEGALAVLDAACAHGIPAVLDADVGERDAIAALVRRATHAIFSQRGLRILADTDDPATGLRIVARQTGAMVGVTLGARGFLWLETGALREIAPPKVTVVDTTAAGDVFHGTFAWALAERQPLAEAARLATIAAALKCTRPGGRTGIPRRAQLDAFIRETA